MDFGNLLTLRETPYKEVTLISILMFIISYVPMLVSLLHELHYSYPAITFDFPIVVIRQIGISLFASVLAAVLITSEFRDQERRRREREERAALLYLSDWFEDHLGLLCEWYVASLPKYPSKAPSTYEEMFNADFLSIVAVLDGYEEYPTTPNASTKDWLSHSAHQCETFREALDNVLNRHSSALSSENLELLNDLRESDLMRQIIVRDGSRDALPEWVSKDSTQLFISDTNYNRTELETHLTLVQDLIAAYDSYPEIQFKSPSQQVAWKEDFAPQPGSGTNPGFRMKIKLNELDDNDSE